MFTTPPSNTKCDYHKPKSVEMKKAVFVFSHLFSYKVYKARKQLAAIDWNFHVNSEVATTKTGDVIVMRKYNQRTKKWNSKVVKVKKKYDYIPVLMGKVLRARTDDVDIVT